MSSPSNKSDKKKFTQLRIYFNVVCQVLIWFLTCTWIKRVICRCFQRVIWWRKGRGIRQTFYILSFRLDTFLFLWVFHCGFAYFWYSGTCFSLFIQVSISACLFRSSTSSCAFLIRSSYLQVYSWRWRSSSLYWVILIVSLWSNKSFNTCLALFVIWKSEESCGCLFLSGREQRYCLQ